MGRRKTAAKKARPVVEEIEPKRSPFTISVAYQLLLVTLITGGALLYAPSGEAAAYLNRMLQTWDAEHYLRISREGYAADGAAQRAIVFFPLYPLLIAGLAPLLGHLAAAFTVTTVASVLGHVLLFNYLRTIGYGWSRVFRVAGLVFATPVSIYFTAVYTEALYFFITVLFLILLKRGEYFLAAVCGGLAALTRNMGLLFVIPYLCACAYSGPRGVVLRRAAYSGLIGAGTAVYLSINYWLFGTPLAFSAQLKQHWYKSSVNPIAKYWTSLTHFSSLAASIKPDYELIYVDRIATLLFPLLCLAYLWTVHSPKAGEGRPEGPRDMPPGFFLWVVAQYVVICSQSFWVSNLRYLSLALPSYLMLEFVLVRRWSYALYLSLSAGLAGWAVHQYVLGAWVF